MPISQIVSYEPATGQELFRAPIGDVDETVARAREAFPGWASRPVANRMEMVRRFANEVRAAADDFAELIARERAKGRVLPAHMPGGPNNPRGARAMYLGNTLYRIHGSNEPWTIGTAVSSGCIRMANDDVVHLYDRVDVGARVVVKR